MKTRVLHHPITKESISLITSAAESDGAYTLIESELMPGGGSTCLFYHRYITKTYTVTKGKLFIHFGGGKIIQLKSGSKYTIQHGEVHSIFNPTTNSSRYMVKLTPGHKGFENMTNILFGMANDRKVAESGLPKDYLTQALLMNLGDTYFTATFCFFEPWIRWHARKAKNRGIEAALISSYCKPW
jgi:mannose-6-phosphate isomerase-like protein (cupin superfamily)